MTTAEADRELQEREAEALDAYSRTVAGVAERLSPSVAHLRVTRQTRRGRIPSGAGSAVVLTPDGFLLTSAHVVSGQHRQGHAAFVVLQRIREYLDGGHDFDSALAEVRRTTVFTTHTPVPAGHDAFAFHIV